MTDLNITLDAFIALIVMESIAKPLAIRVGRSTPRNRPAHAPWGVE